MATKLKSSVLQLEVVWEGPLGELSGVFKDGIKDESRTGRLLRNAKQRGVFWTKELDNR